MLDLAILGLLDERPMHGYELRKRLSPVLGAFRAVSYGSLYPCLRSLAERGWVRVDEAGPAPGRARRTRVTYELTPAGREHFRRALTEAGPDAWEDGTFAVHFAFLGRVPREARLRILEGRRRRLEQRLDAARDPAGHPGRADTWTAELHRHALESTEREVRWLTGLIDGQRVGQDHR